MILLLLGCADPGVTTTGTAPLLVSFTAEPHPVVPLAGRIRVELAEPAEVSVACTSPDEPEEDFRLEAPAAAEHELAVPGLLADTAYTCTVTAGGDRAEATFTSGPVPEGTPVLEPVGERQEPSWGAWTLFNHQRICEDEPQGRLVIVDPEGRVRWVHVLPTLDEPPKVDVVPSMPTGDTVLYGGGQAPEYAPALLDLEGNVLGDTRYPGHEDDLYHHDVAPTGPTTAIGFVEDEATAGATTWTGFALVEQDLAAGVELRRWRTQQAVDAGELPGGFAEGDEGYHPTSLQVVGDDPDGPAEWVYLLRQDWIVRIDRATGAVTWRLGPHGDFALLDADGTPASEAGWFDTVHGFHVDTTDGLTLLVYDNGKDTRRSRAVAYRLDPAARTATLLWEWTEDHWYDPHWGNVQALPGGHVFINMSSTPCKAGSDPDHTGALVELDPATFEVTWRLEFPDILDSTYRAVRLDGCSVFPNRRYCPEGG